MSLRANAVGVTMGCAVAALVVTACGHGANDDRADLRAGGASLDSIATTRVASTVRVVPDQADALAPLASAATLRLTAEQVRTTLLRSGNQAAAAYLGSPS